ncbi:MAG: hypothetical protein J0I45_18530 [Bosea sp.]|nr:hypothetical protein [Bosea sp. (in: a-proteobacteria)]
MRFTVAFLTLALATVPAIAKDHAKDHAKDPWPSLVGTWVGKSRAIVTAASGHYGDAGAGAEPRFASAELTIEIAKEDEGRYLGTITSRGQSEPKLMVVGDDRKTLRTADGDGTSVGTILGKDSFELCYAQNNPSTVSCITFHRKK